MEKFLEGSSLESRQNDREYILTFNSTEAIQDFYMKSILLQV